MGAPTGGPERSQFLEGVGDQGAEQIGPVGLGLQLDRSDDVTGSPGQVPDGIGQHDDGDAEGDGGATPRVIQPVPDGGPTGDDGDDHGHRCRQGGNDQDLDGHEELGDHEGAEGETTSAGAPLLSNEQFVEHEQYQRWEHKEGQV